MTTAGVTFFTMSENPWAIEGGTPAARAPGRAVERMTTHESTDAMQTLLHFTITRLLQKL
ncbi:MAG: hypothetical protein NTNFB02_06580 [Nitrospira sp.]